MTQGLPGATRSIGMKGGSEEGTRVCTTPHCFADVFFQEKSYSCPGTVILAGATRLEESVRSSFCNELSKISTCFVSGRVIFP